MIKSVKKSLIAFILLVISFISLASIMASNIEDAIKDDELNNYIHPLAGFSNLYESSDPLEVGSTVLIRVEVLDPQGFKQVLIEFEGVNRSMVNIPGTDIWEYNWTSTFIGLFPYTIYSKFNVNKWNSMSDSIQVVLDATPPEFTVIEKHPPSIKVGEKIRISIEVIDPNGVKQVLIEFKKTNHSMVNLPSSDIWQYNITPSNSGKFHFTIWMKDNNDNVYSISDSFEVEDPNITDYIEDKNDITSVPSMLLLILPIIGAVGFMAGVIVVKKTKSKGPHVSRDPDTVKDKEKKRMEIKVPVEKIAISIVCPICKVKINIRVPKTVINESKQLTTVSIPKEIGCEHHYQIFVDKNFVVRGYQKVDYEFDLNDLQDIEVIKENNHNINN